MPGSVKPNEHLYRPCQVFNHVASCFVKHAASIARTRCSCKIVMKDTIGAVHTYLFISWKPFDVNITVIGTFMVFIITVVLFQQSHFTVCLLDANRLQYPSFCELVCV